MNIVSLAILLAVTSCKGGRQESSGDVPSSEETYLLRVGAEIVTEADLAYLLKEKYDGRSDEATREQALGELTKRAQYAQAAHDAGLGNDVVVRAEFARILKDRYREGKLFPQVKELTAESISEIELRDLYDAQKTRFQSAEKRQVAVLWLNPGPSPERLTAYQQKLNAARSWAEENSELKNDPKKGFSVLSVDHSEHAASRFKGGVVGWMEEGGGMDKWSKAVSEIVFELKSPGDVSEVVSRGEGVFLVRYMELKPAVVRSFEAVKGDLARTLKKKRREALEANFEQEITSKYPVERRGE